MKKLKILIITPTFFPVISGNSVCAKRIATGLEKLDHEILIKTPKQIDFDEIKNFNPDIIHGLHAYKCKIVQKLSSKFKTPYLLTLTGSDYEECLIDSIKFEKGLEQNNVKHITLDIMRNASYLIVYNKRTSTRIIDQFAEFRPKLKVISKGLPIIDGKDYKFRKSNNISKTDFVFSLVSGIRIRKNNFCPIESLTKLREKYKNIILTFVGPVIEKDYNLELTKKIKGLDWIRAVGAVRVDQMKQIYLESDVILNCSHYEGESNAIIEAMYYSKPLIVSNTPGNRPLINNMKDGLLFELNDSDDFREKAQLLLTDKGLKAKISKNAKAKSLKLINSDESKDYEKLYLSAIDLF